MNDKTALSAYSSARLAIKDIVTIGLSGGQGQKLSMDQFLTHRGRIFLLNNPMQAAEQSGAFAIFLSAFMLSCLSQADTSEPRACAIIDEALSFNLPSTVEQAVSAQSRSKGLMTIAGAQWIPRGGRRFLTRAEFIFGMRVGDLSTAKTLSELVGHAVFDEISESKTKGSSSGGSHDSSSYSHQERKREIMPPESFRSLPQRSFILLHQAGIAPGYTSSVAGEQNENIPAFEYQSQPLISEYMKVL
jgi:type IV secretory pathway TraG/TraD family ATPase VirD4